MKWSTDLPFSCISLPCSRWLGPSTLLLPFASNLLQVPQLLTSILSLVKFRKVSDIGFMWPLPRIPVSGLPLPGLLAILQEGFHDQGQGKLNYNRNTLICSTWELLAIYFIPFQFNFQYFIIKVSKFDRKIETTMNYDSAISNLNISLFLLYSFKGIKYYSWALWTFLTPSTYLSLLAQFLHFNVICVSP